MREEGVYIVRKQAVAMFIRLVGCVYVRTLDCVVGVCFLGLVVQVESIILK